ncbi:MAG: sigma-54-dependent transcriptional regulator [Myxococcales bacterium]|jgi:DNA-binding NtrC family response regulator
MKILVIDDEAAIREVLQTRLEALGHEVNVAKDATSARRLLEEADPDLILSDVCLPDANGVELVELFRTAGGRRPVILMTAFGTIEVAVEAMKRGASDFLTKPLDYPRLHATLAKLEKEVEFRRASEPGEPGGGGAAVAEEEGLGALVGKSPPMQALYDQLRKLAPTDAPIFIYGESGTGKEVVARTVHALSRRAQGPFLPLNMAALPEGVVEAELLGHARGSFTGAVAARPGAFELADGGTLFLDEIAEMPAALQPKLLRVLEDGCARPIGARAEVRFDTRVLAATNRDPHTAIAEGRLREDLFFRLNVCTLVLPPLRERREDIPLLARRFLQQMNQKHSTAVTDLADDALAALMGHAWPGNVRELRNAIERAVILAQEGRLRRQHFPLSVAEAPAAAGTNGPLVLPADVTAAEAERLLILETLRQVRNNKAAAARRLGMDVKTIRNKLKAYGVMSSGE